MSVCKGGVKQKPMPACTHGVPHEACYHKECHSPTPSPSQLEEEAEEKEFKENRLWKEFKGDKEGAVVPPDPDITTNDQFHAVIDNAIERIRSSLASKGKEYGRGDRLSNFKRVADMLGTTPERALLGMWSKHIESTITIIGDIGKGDIPKPELLNEKMMDMINYPILLEALILERYR
jgi:hypothetical protein